MTEERETEGKAPEVSEEGANAVRSGAGTGARRQPPGVDDLGVEEPGEGGDPARAGEFVSGAEYGSDGGSDSDSDSDSDSGGEQPNDSDRVEFGESGSPGPARSGPARSPRSVVDEFFASPGDDVLLDGSSAPPGFRTGYVALVGRPNVGKSTLMNRFLEEKIAIVTPKPQTTRRKTLGILNTDRYQMVLLDTPGIMQPKYALHTAMLHEALSALDDADVVVFLVDASKPMEILPSIEKIQAPRLVALNKVDRVTKKAEMIPIIDGYWQSGLFDEIFPISALRGDGVDDLLDGILARLPEGPPFYSAEQISEQPERFFVAEIVREQIFRLYQQEVPYSTEVLITQFDERERGKDFVEATIFVESDSQKAILIGRKGLAIKELGEDARAAVESFLGREVFLSLKVKTMPKWRKKAGSLRKLGYKG